MDYTYKQKVMSMAAQKYQNDALGFGYKVCIKLIHLAVVSKFLIENYYY